MTRDGDDRSGEGRGSEGTARSTDVKICGICRPRDAAVAVEAGATHIGVIRVPGSRRTRPAEVVAEVCAAAGSARKVGVYVDAPTGTILREATSLGLDVIQLHGSEDPSRVSALAAGGLEVWKVVKPRGPRELRDAAQRYRSADLILVEGSGDGDHGGTGTRFPWDELEAELKALSAARRIGVAGGLTPGNVAEAVRRFRPALVDVSSGVESAPCEKDADRVRAFIRAARGARAGPSSG